MTFVPCKMGTAAGCREDQGLGCSFIFPPMEFKLVKNTTKTRGRKRGKERPIEFFMNDFCQRRRNICVYEGSEEGTQQKQDATAWSWVPKDVYNAPFQ